MTNSDDECVIVKVVLPKEHKEPKELLTHKKEPPSQLPQKASILKVGKMKRGKMWMVCFGNYLSITSDLIHTVL